MQVGRPRDYEWLGRQLRSGIEKHPVTGPVSVLATHLDGDEQADPEHHGGQDKAVYAYASEDLRWWAQTLGGAALDPGVVGENLTTQGMDLRDAVIGEQWRVGSALLQVSEPRTPCWKLGMRMQDPRFPRAFARGATGRAVAGPTAGAAVGRCAGDGHAHPGARRHRGRRFRALRR